MVVENECVCVCVHACKYFYEFIKAEATRAQESHNWFQFHPRVLLLWQTGELQKLRQLIVPATTDLCGCSGA